MILENAANAICPDKKMNVLLLKHFSSFKLRIHIYVIAVLTLFLCLLMPVSVLANCNSQLQNKIFINVFERDDARLNLELANNYELCATEIVNKAKSFNDLSQLFMNSIEFFPSSTFASTLYEEMKLRNMLTDNTMTNATLLSFKKDSNRQEPYLVMKFLLSQRFYFYPDGLGNDLID